MKKIFMLFLLCFTVLSSSAFADDNPWAQKVNLDAILNVIKTTNVKQYMEPNKFIEYIEKHWEPTFQDLLDACIVSVSQDVEKNCKIFFREVVTEHNRLVDNANFAQEIAKPENWKEAQVYPAEMPNDGSTLIIKRDLDGGTPVSGNCANQIIIKSGTSVTLDCDAVKNGKHLTGYVDNNGFKINKNWKFGFDGKLSQAEINGGAVPLSLTAIYEGDGEKQKAESADDLRQQRSDNRKDKIRHLRRNPGAEFTDAELKLYDEANVYAGAAVRRYMALVQYRDASGNLKKGDRTKLVMYDCDVDAKMCGFTFVGEKSGVNALACCHNIRNSGAICSLPYTWRKGDVEHTSVSDCR